MFRFGADYYPEHWPEERWATDARLMQEAGFNTVRLAEFAWSRLEPQPDRFDFSWLDRAIDLLAAHGMQVVLGTPTASPPPWVMEMHPDAFLVMQSGRRRTYGNRREVCPTHAGYRERSRRITGAMADHYRPHPAVIGWQIDNEFGDRCFCPNCRQSFARWLQERYGSLDALNEAWGTVFWSHVYSDWSQISPPLETAGPFTHGSPNPGLGLDYYRFLSDTYVDFQSEQVRILRRLCPHHFITHNFMGFGYDLIDYFDLAADLDFVSWDNYRRMQWTHGQPVDPATAALSHAAMRGLKGRSFWVMEQQSGSGGWDIAGEAVRPGELRLWSYQSIGHGADGVVFFRWRTARVGTEQYWHGILDHDGRPRRRYAEVKALGAELRRIGGEIAGTRVEAEVAIVLSYDSRFAFQIQPNNPGFRYSRHVQEIFSAFHRRGVAVDIVRPDADLARYKLAIAPALYVLDEPTAAALERYVEAGGVLMVTARSGVKDAANRVVDLPLPGLLAEVCGVTVEEYDSLPLGVSQPLAFASGIAGSGAAAVWCDVLEPAGAEVLASYTADYYAGRAAVTAHRFGRGRAVYVGTFGDEALQTTLAGWLLEAAGVAAGPPAPAGVEVCMRQADTRSLLFVLNHTAEEMEFELGRACIDLVEGVELPTGPIRLAPRGVRILL